MHHVCGFQKKSITIFSLLVVSLVICFRSKNAHCETKVDSQKSERKITMKETTYAVTHYSNEHFGEVRTLIINSTPYFFTKDIATALGYSNPREAMVKHVDCGDKCMVNCNIGGEIQPVPVINEGGFYSLVNFSDLYSRLLFKRWITSEVLPDIRSRILNESTASDVKYLYDIIKSQSDTIQSMTRQLETCKTFKSDAKTYDAKSDNSKSFEPIGIDVYTFTRKLRDYYGVTFGRKGMFAWLRENGFLYSDRDHRNYPTEKYANAGWFVVKRRLSETGYLLYTQTLITPLGEKRLLQELGVDIDA
jgi:anti-repressor protein